MGLGHCANDLALAAGPPSHIRVSPIRLRSLAYAGLATGWRSPLFAAALLVAFPYRRVRAALPARPVAAGATPSLPLGVLQFLSPCRCAGAPSRDRKSTRLNSSH